jgi:hypothetical protein
MSQADEQLRRAMRALAHERPATPDEVRATRRRVLAAQAERTPDRSRYAIAAAALLALSVGSTAWAAATGHLSWLAPLVRRAPIVAPAPRPSSTAPRAPLPAPEMLPATPLPAPEMLAATPLPAPEMLAATPLPAPETSAITPRPSPETPAMARGAARPAMARARTLALEPSPASEPLLAAPASEPVPSAPALSAAQPETAAPAPSDDDPAWDALYRAGHHAHFVARDPAAALRAWDQYLAVAPQGRFAPEVRFNRALDLLRLERRDEARAALLALRSTGYRARDVARLLAALEDAR